MTLQYAKELLLMEIAEVIEAKNKKIEELSVENSMLNYRIHELECRLAETMKAENPKINTE